MVAHNRPEKPAASERLLTTREAATFLKVSEASIRRWTDSGLLPASRVGRRGARRLRDEDLRSFLEAGRTQNVAATEISLASTMIIQDVVVPLGSHLASFYSTEAGRLAGFTCPLPRPSCLARAFKYQATVKHGVAGVSGELPPPSTRSSTCRGSPTVPGWPASTAPAS